MIGFTQFVRQSLLMISNQELEILNYALLK